MMSIIIARTDYISAGIAKLVVLMEWSLLVVRSIPDGGSILIFSKNYKSHEILLFIF